MKYPPAPKANSSRKNQEGFSLIELLLVCVMLTVILGIITVVVSGLQSNYAQRRSRVEQLNDGSAVLDLITHIIRVAGANTTSQALTPTGTNQLRIRADWNPMDGNLNGQYEDVTFFVSNKTLSIRNEITTVQTDLVSNVNSLKFEYFDSNGNTTANPTQIARVKITLEIGTNSPRTFSSNILIRKGLAIKTN